MNKLLQFKLYCNFICLNLEIGYLYRDNLFKHICNNFSIAVYIKIYKNIDQDTSWSYFLKIMKDKKSDENYT